MTDFCDFVPDDPSCQKPEPEPKPDGGDFDKDGGFGKDGDDLALGPIDDDKLGQEELEDKSDMEKIMETGRADGLMSWDDVEAQI